MTLVLSLTKDTCSSLRLEDAASAFQVRVPWLELNWTVVKWDSDLRWRGKD